MLGAGQCCSLRFQTSRYSHCEVRSLVAVGCFELRTTDCSMIALRCIEVSDTGRERAGLRVLRFSELVVR